MKPLLALSKVVLPEQVELPCYASTKLDGIRACMVDGIAMSRNEKPIPNEWVQRCLRGLHGLDGEILLDDPDKDFNDQQSAFMSVHGKPNFTYHVFDYWDSNKPFADRLNKVKEISKTAAYVEVIEQHRISRVEELILFYNSEVARGQEGVICRKILGKYKHGRSTLNQQLSLKLKPWKDAEAIVIGMERLVDQSGVAHNMLGKFIVKMNGVEFGIGTGEGLTHERRYHYWAHAAEYFGQTVTFRYAELSKYGVPRFPSWRGFRDE